MRCLCNYCKSIHAGSNRYTQSSISHGDSVIYAEPDERRVATPRQGTSQDQPYAEPDVAGRQVNGGQMSNDGSRSPVRSSNDEAYAEPDLSVFRHINPAPPPSSVVAKNAYEDVDSVSNSVQAGGDSPNPSRRTDGYEEAMSPTFVLAKPGDDEAISHETNPEMRSSDLATKKGNLPCNVSYARVQKKKSHEHLDSNPDVPATTLQQAQLTKKPTNDEYGNLQSLVSPSVDDNATYQKLRENQPVMMISSQDVGQDYGHLKPVVAVPGDSAATVDDGTYHKLDRGLNGKNM